MTRPPVFFPLSFAQQRLLFLDRLDQGTSAYNLTRVVRLTGSLDSDSLTRALNIIVDRHATLRTRFIFDAGDGFQVVDTAIKQQLPLIDLCPINEKDRMPEALRLAQREGTKSFDLTTGPLFRLLLLRLSPSVHILVLVFHHIVTDGWSMSIFFEELGKLYVECVQGTPANLPALSIAYSDFAQWQRDRFTSSKHGSQVLYWSEKLHEHAGFLQLPTDRGRPSIQTHRGAIETFQIGEGCADAINRLAKRTGTTLFMVLLAAFQTLLWRLTGSEDVLVGTPIAGRMTPQVEPLIGLFANTLVMRGNLAGDPTFIELVARTRKHELDAYDHQDMPFEKLVEAVNPKRSSTHSPLFQVMFVLQNAPKQLLELPGLTLQELEFDAGTSKFDLTLEIVERDGFYCIFEYSTDLFERRSISRIARQFNTLLDNVAAEPDRTLSHLEILDDAARKELVVGFNANTVNYDRTARIEQLFRQQVERSPNRVALVEGDRKITYRDLDKKSEALAHFLAKRDCNQDRPVGIYFERSIDAVVAMLAALKANIPYVPLDVANPLHRIELLINDAGCNVILTHRGRCLPLPGNIELIHVDQQLVDEAPPAPLPQNGTSGDLAYIIYTSGSTGIPKGVEGSHQSAANRFAWMWQAYPFSTDETCCQKTALGFVDAVWEIFGPLLAGVPSVIVPDEIVLEPELFVDLLAKHEVTRIVLVPSFLRAILSSVPDLGGRLAGVRLWSVSGEVFSLDLAEKFRIALPSATLLNIYGSSEVTADATYYEVGETLDLSSIPIGRPIANTHVIVLDSQKALAPPLVPGEIHVGGDALARGYWKKPDLTAERFIANPFRPDQSQRLFATGDLGRVLSDGTIEYLGRLDAQVKIRGIRIEPNEVEANLLAHPLVRHAAVAARGGSSEAQILIGYVVLSEEKAASAVDDIRGFLRTRLPDYMVPSVLVELDRLPVLPSGKVNHRALPTPSPDLLARRGQVIAPRDAIEEQLSAIWQEVLERDDFGVEDDFFELGGHSLSAMRVLARVRRDFGVDIPIRRLFDSPTIAALGDELGAQRYAGANIHAVPIAASAQSSPALLDALRAGLGSLSPEQLNALVESVRAERRSTLKRNEDS
jgi:amino acid adenylation domain-containing protein